MESGARSAAAKVARVAGATGAGIGIASVAGSLSAGAYLARLLLTPERDRPEEQEIVEVDAATITLRADEETVVPGRYGLWFDQGQGHLRLGEIIDLDTGAHVGASAPPGRGDMSAGAAPESAQHSAYIFAVGIVGWLGALERDLEFGSPAPSYEIFLEWLLAGLPVGGHPTTSD